MKPAHPKLKTRLSAALLAALTLISAPAPAQPGSPQALPALGDGVELSMASERRLGDALRDMLGTDLSR